MINNKVKNAIQELKVKIEAQFGNVEIILFGSTARGTAGYESDIDLLILVPCELNNSIEESIFETAFDIELKYDVIFGIITYSKKLWESPQAEAMPLYQNITLEGMIL